MEPLETLLQRAQDGDVAAYGRIVRRFERMAGGYAYAILGDVHLAEDAVQEAFIEVYTHLSRVYGPAAFPGFLRSAVSKHCDRTTRKRRPEVGLDEASAPATSGTPEQDLERDEANRRIHRAFLTLPLSERQVVVLYYVHRHKRREIAAFLDLPLETVIYRLRNARQRLRKELDAMNPDRFADITTRPAEDAGRAAFKEIDVDDVDSGLATYLGRLKDSTSMGINLLHHSLDVAHLAGIIAADLGLDVRLAQRAGLLHDIGKAAPAENPHTERGVELGERHNEHPEVREVIASHHDPNDSLSCYTFAVKAADHLASAAPSGGLEAAVPQVVDLQTVADSWADVTSVHAVRVRDEMWVLVRGWQRVDAEVLRHQVSTAIKTDAPILITLAADASD